MYTLTYNSISYSVNHAVKGRNFIHGYNANGVLVVSFEGVTDFSGFSYSGTYLNPEDCLQEDCNAVKFHDGLLKRPDGTSISPVKVTGSGTVTVSLENGREYVYTAVTSLSITVAAVDCHGFVTFADTIPTVTITGQAGLMGGIVDATAGETWEFDCRDGYILWVKWGE